MFEPDALTDSFGRRINYLRISLTDRCNFKCLYCFPGQALTPVPVRGMLSREEIVRFVTVAVRLGFQHVRLTGGEPLLRDDLVDIVRDLKRISAVPDLSITTNGSRLGPQLKRLKEAGLDRLNISLDCLNIERFKKITLSNCYREVLGSVRAALEEGFAVKLNMVVLRGINDHEVTGLAHLAFVYPLEARFLEFMPLCGPAWNAAFFVPASEVRRRIEQSHVLEEIPGRTHEAARVFSLLGGKGRVGFIASLTEPFCADCSRMRLTCDGMIRPCLFSGESVSVKELLTQDAPDAGIIEALRRAVQVKPKGNPFYGRPYRQDLEPAADPVATPYIRSVGG